MPKRPRILITRQLPEPAQSNLAALHDAFDIVQYCGDGAIPRETLLAHAASAPLDGILCLLSEAIDTEFLDAAAPSLTVVSTMSVGMDHLDLPAITSRGIRVGYTPDVLTDACAELALALILMATRCLGAYIRVVQRHEWGREWLPTWMLGRQLRGSVVAVIGLGRIGQRVVQLLAPHGIGRVVYHNRSPLPEDVMEKCIPKDVVVEYAATLREALEPADIVLACCPLTPTTHHMFNATAFAYMRPSAVFINIARGALVDESALAVALSTGVIAGAALDVTDPEPLASDSPLRELDNCVVLPHVGSATMETRGDMACLAVENLVCGLRGEAMPAEFRASSG